MTDIKRGPPLYVWFFEYSELSPLFKNMSDRNL